MSTPGVLEVVSCSLMCENSSCLFWLDICKDTHEYFLLGDKRTFKGLSFIGNRGKLTTILSCYTGFPSFCCMYNVIMFQNLWVSENILDKDKDKISNDLFYNHNKTVTKSISSEYKVKLRCLYLSMLSQLYKYLSLCSCNYWNVNFIPS